VDFIPLITESGSIMFSMVKDEVAQEWELSPSDRCDRCNAEALVRVTGISGELMFCGHHYNKIMDNSEGYKKMMSFALTVLDEREKLVS
jgi:protocatechuate 3,4-dioxygenase beta subunit